jgi:hypothetical protein
MHTTAPCHTLALVQQLSGNGFNPWICRPSGSWGTSLVRRTFARLKDSPPGDHTRESTSVPVLHLPSEQLVVGLMRADPKPVVSAAAVARHGPIRSANFNRIDVTLSGKAQRRVTRVVLKEGKLLIRELPERLKGYRPGLTHADESLETMEGCPLQSAHPPLRVTPCLPRPMKSPARSDRPMPWNRARSSKLPRQSAPREGGVQSIPWRRTRGGASDGARRDENLA